MMFGMNSYTGLKSSSGGVSLHALRSLVARVARHRGSLVLFPEHGCFAVDYEDVLRALALRKRYTFASNPKPVQDVSTPTDSTQRNFFPDPVQEHIPLPNPSASSFGRKIPQQQRLLLALGAQPDVCVRAAS
jgi:hypothetical protein